MRYSIIGLLGTGLVSVAVGCGDGEDPGANAAGGAAGKAAAGSSGKGSSGGNGSAGKAGNSSTGGSGGTSGTKATGGTSTTGGTGAKGGTHAKGGAGGSVGGSGGAGGTHVTAGTGGTLIVEGGNGGQPGDSGAAGMAGADAAGNGGESGSAGAGGAAECGDPLTRTLDQSQLVASGNSGLMETQRPGQSFTVGTAGLLTGIEVAVGPCNDADVSGYVRLELFDSQGTSLGHVRLPQSSLPNTCAGEPLAEQTVGAGYFDLTSLCISAGVGDVFTFILSLTGNPPVTCDTGNHECSNNGNFCFDASDCNGNYYAVGDTNCGGYGCDGAPSGYAGGSEFFQNVGTGELQPDLAFEMAFKTFVQ